MIAIGLSGQDDYNIALCVNNLSLQMTKEQAQLIIDQLEIVIEFVKKHENEDKQ